MFVHQRVDPDLHIPMVRSRRGEPRRAPRQAVAEMLQVSPADVQVTLKCREELEKYLRKPSWSMGIPLFQLFTIYDISE